MIIRINDIAFLEFLLQVEFGPLFLSLLVEERGWRKRYSLLDNLRVSNFLDSDWLLPYMHIKRGVFEFIVKSVYKLNLYSNCVNKRLSYNHNFCVNKKNILQYVSINIFYTIYLQNINFEVYFEIQGYFTNILEVHFEKYFGGVEYPYVTILEVYFEKYFGGGSTPLLQF